MMTSNDVQILIAGAGPTGLTLACDLARRGVQFRIVDKAQAYFIGSKGKGLQPRSLEVMDDFGIVDQVLRNGKFHVPFRGYDGTKVLGERDSHEGRYPTPSTPYASPLITPQCVWKRLCGSFWKEAAGGLSWRPNWLRLSKTRILSPRR
ncbi:MAG TPA: FAD-dependent monooxygenase [Bryobacteraceae bacterium]|nr:FAD-dependent monooxygenase [Bryobacteraceae bacterium]